MHADEKIKMPWNEIMTYTLSKYLLNKHCFILLLSLPIKLNSRKNSIKVFEGFEVKPIT